MQLKFNLLIDIYELLNFTSTVLLASQYLFQDVILVVFIYKISFPLQAICFLIIAGLINKYELC